MKPQFLLPLFLIFSFFSVISLASERFEYTQVGLAIAGPGPGASMMGHSFLIFYKANNLLSESISYGFNVAEDEEDDEYFGFAKEQSQFAQIKSTLGYGKRFVIDRIQGNLKIDQYVLENRLTVIYFLKLTPAQIQKLHSNLENEYQDREKTPRHDYDFLNRNCLTESLRQVNSVLDAKSEKFVFNDNEDFRWTAANILSPLFKSWNAPYFQAPKLDRHSLVDHKQVVLPELAQEAGWYVKLMTDAEVLQNICPAQKNFYAVVTKISGKEDIRNSQSFLNYAHSTLQLCPGQKTQEAYLRFLKDLYFLANDIHGKIRIEKMRKLEAINAKP